MKLICLIINHKFKKINYRGQIVKTCLNCGKIKNTNQNLFKIMS